MLTIFNHSQLSPEAWCLPWLLLTLFRSMLRRLGCNVMEGFPILSSIEIWMAQNASEYLCTRKAWKEILIEDIASVINSTLDLNNSISAVSSRSFLIQLANRHHAWLILS